MKLDLDAGFRHPAGELQHDVRRSDFETGILCAFSDLLRSFKLEQHRGVRNVSGLGVSIQFLI